MFKKGLAVFLLFVFMMGFGLTQAEAKIPIPVGFGDQISEVYDLPNQDFGKQNVGYMYGSFRILFIPIITWGGKLVVYEDNTYGELKPEELKILEDKFGKMNKRVGLWIRFVNYLWLLIVPVGLFLWIKSYSQE